MDGRSRCHAVRPDCRGSIRVLNRLWPGVAGRLIVRMRLPPLRRFLAEAGYLADVVLSRKRVRQPEGKATPPISEVASRELDEWAMSQREIRGSASDCVPHRRAWVAGLVDSLCSTGGIDWVAYRA